MKSPERLKGTIRNIAKAKNLCPQEILQMFLFERIIEKDAFGIGIGHNAAAAAAFQQEAGMTQIAEIHRQLPSFNKSTL